MNFGERAWLVATVAACAVAVGCSDQPAADPEFAKMLAEAARPDSPPAVRSVTQQGIVEGLTARAMRGDYQTQRNLAYLLSAGDATMFPRPIDGCAWRMVILFSGHDLVDASDAGNLEHYCGRLTRAEQLAASAKADRIRLEMLELR